MGETRYTEKEMVMAKRKAFESGAHWFYGREETPRALGHLTVQAVAVARNAYPLPKVERPRVVTDKQGAEWRVIGDVAQVRFDANHTWESRPIVSMTKDRALLIADLFARPSELVDDEG